jgi:methionyl-tRNA formyltransferase
VGYHPAALPRNRGRHPIIWALALGLKETASTFFFMDEGADSGPILDQQPVLIETNDDARTLYEKLTAIARVQVRSFLPKLASGDFPRLEQDHGVATYWRKRGKDDGKIDWRMPAEGVHNLVRALTRPYPGAHCVVQGVEAKVWATRVVEAGHPNDEPGKVLTTDATGAVRVKCGTGAIELVRHELPRQPQPGEYL